MAEQVNATSFDTKKSLILDTACDVINSGDYAGMTLAKLADRVGMKYNGFYHYFAGKDDLAEQAFARACAARHQRMHAAPPQVPGLMRLLEFVEADLNASDAVRLAHVDALPETSRQHIHQQMADNVKNLAAIVQMGIADGSIRACNPEVVAVVVLDLLDRFVYPTDVADGRVLDKRELIPLILDTFRHGLLAHPRDISKPPLHSLPAITPPEDCEYANIDHLLHGFTQTLNLKGVTAATIPEFAASIGLSKTAVYQLAADKEELIFYCLLRGMKTMETTGLIAEALTENPSDEIILWLRQISYLHAMPAGPLPMFGELDSLHPHHRRTLRARYAAIQTRMVQRLQRAVELGELRHDNPQSMLPIVMNYGSVFWRVAPEILPPDLAHEEMVDEVQHCVWMGLATC